MLQERERERQDVGVLHKLLLSLLYCKQSSVWIVVVLIGASLSKPHISMTSLPTRVYAWTDHLLYVTSSIYFVRFASCVNSKRTPGVEDMKQFKHEQYYLLDGDNKDGDHPSTYLFTG